MYVKMTKEILYKELKESIMTIIQQIGYCDKFIEII